MTSSKYIGYVGGVAVAAGVGAAIAVAGQGTASADAPDTGSAAKASTSSSSVKAGPKRIGSVKAGNAKAGSAKADRAKPLAKVNDRVEKVASHVTSQLNKSASTVSKSITDSLNKPSAKPAKPKAKPSAAEFEAKQVERLKNMFTPKQAVAPKPDSALDDNAENKTVVNAPAVRTAVQTQADTAADGPAWSPNPFRPDDPDPTDIPDAIMDLRNALTAATPNVLDPFVREGVEQIYRGTQIVPWVNAVVPVSKILPSLAPAVGNDDAARAARQLIINELIKTTPPGSLLYYGYDIAADLLNFDNEAAELKSQFVTTAWDILDPFELAHNKGESGIGQAAG